VDTTTHSEKTIRECEEMITRELGHRHAVVHTRREAAAFLAKSQAQCIADDVVDGKAQWQPRVDRYRYLRDLATDLYEQAEQARRKDA
jgi:uncharacterized membrane-anchored protein YjiN (DUF445 family)